MDHFTAHGRVNVFIDNHMATRVGITFTIPKDANMKMSFPLR